MVWSNKSLHALLLLGLLLLCCLSSTYDKLSCPTCKKIASNFLKAVEDTSRKNFGGGNTDWEERYLSKYEFSETRLVEIIESLCENSEFECNLMVETHEEYIERWWFTMQKNHPNFFLWFCVDTIKACCPAGTFGVDCVECPGGADKPCNGHGSCNGDGTRTGDGSCSCTKEYKGEDCLDCANGYYSEFQNETYSLCTDVDECLAETTPCKRHTYCSNTEGSYSCEACDVACDACTGGSPEECINCTTGYTLEEQKCIDVNECSMDDKVCTHENEDCINTEGSFKCVCSEGYEEREGICVEIKVSAEMKDSEDQNVVEPEALADVDPHEDL
ncbi:cysteine-rich with EGF-like domain protein 2-A isoform X5 [Chiloscyllium plagiosum]|uniref:cysteine-rich with EGF-like domain protein 2-A isoform X5 n=1 Tax=Chiloscyllium plagiosum TaxID=36176 RepID=UPI001CB7BA9F|nr:cysteine-rich with EGF-like domain protein 2-A isoform X5 [Chiloscyllium plagiosum]